MYTVGSWFTILMDLAILAIVGIVALIYINYKRGQYQRAAVRCIRAEVVQPTGWSKFYIVPCEPDAKSVTVDGLSYFLDFPETEVIVGAAQIDRGKGNPGKGEKEKEAPANQRRWGRHPMVPFLGLTTMQVPIRIETWYLDNPIPVRQGAVPSPDYMAMEIEAMKRGAIAAAGTIKLAETEARQKELANAIGNQPNKTYVYAGIVAILIAVIVVGVLIVQGTL